MRPLGALELVPTGVVLPPSPDLLERTTTVLGFEQCVAKAVERCRHKAPQRHLVVNTLVTEWNEHEARAISDVIFVLQGDTGWAIQVVGRYHDTLRHDEGTWRFRRRAAEFVP